jgi:hypothetical protein
MGADINNGISWMIFKVKGSIIYSYLFESRNIFLDLDILSTLLGILPSDKIGP